MDFLATLAAIVAVSVSFVFSVGFAWALSLPLVPRELWEPWLLPQRLTWLPLRVLAANGDGNLLQWSGKIR